MGFLKDKIGGLFAGMGGAPGTGGMPGAGDGMQGIDLEALRNLGLDKMLGQDGMMRPNGAARAMGRVVGADPSRISKIAHGVGGVANSVAEAGGAAPGYRTQPFGEPQPINNHMQLTQLNPEALRALIEKFRVQQQ